MCARCAVEKERQGIPRSPSPEPVYDSKGVRVNTRIQRKRDAITKQRQALIAEYQTLNNGELPPGISKAEAKLTKRYDIPVDKYPDYNCTAWLRSPLARCSLVLCGCCLCVQSWV